MYVYDVWSREPHPPRTGRVWHHAYTYLVPSSRFVRNILSVYRPLAVGVVVGVVLTCRPFWCTTIILCAMVGYGNRSDRDNGKGFSGCQVLLNVKGIKLSDLARTGQKSGCPGSREKQLSTQTFVFSLTILCLGALLNWITLTGHHH